MPYKGKYRPEHPEKYVGNSSNIIYRSLLERRFMVFCDRNDSVLKWSSEELAIPYVSPIDNRVHRYILGKTLNNWSRARKLCKEL